MVVVSEIQQDFITEALNIGTGHAASSLSEMVDEPVLLSVPQVFFVTRREAADRFDQSAMDKLSGVSQHFDGSFDGEALLLFPESHSLSVVRLLIGEDVSEESMTDLEQEALSEIGNIILNAIIGSMANILDDEMSTSLPVFMRGSCEEIMSVGDEDDQGEGIVMFVKVDLLLEKQKVNGYVTLLLDVESIKNFIQKADERLEAL